MSPAFELDEVHVDPSTGEVSGPGGCEKLDPKVMDVLVLLAGQAGEVVARDELHAKLWPNAVVTDYALSRCFYELRRQLSRAGGDERYRDLLETLPKRGYRLNGKVRPAPGRRPWRLAAVAITGLALVGLAVFIGLRREDPPVDPSIAVLPFTDMSAAGDQDYFSDGISEEILNRLAQTSSLRVISRTSSFSFRDQAVDVPEIAAKLDVSHVLEGSVRRSGDRVRITAQLISAATNAHVWSHTYDRGFGDIFAVQDEIASAVAAALDTRLSGTKPSAEPPKAQAYERYLKARYFFNRRAPGDLQLMAKYLEEAVAIDPGFAPAWAELAGAYHLLAFENPEAESAWRAKRASAALRAVDLDPTLPAAHIRLAQHYWQAGDRAQSDAHFQMARELDPDDLLLLSMDAEYAMFQGDPGKAVELQRRAVALDPLSAAQHNNLGSFLKAAGRYEEALAEKRIHDELSLAAGSRHDAETVRLLVLLGRFDEASAVIAAMPEGMHRDFGLALLYPAPSRQADADAALQRMAARPPIVDDVFLPEVYAQRGMDDLVFESLRSIREAIQQDAADDHAQEHYLRHRLQESPFLQRLRSDPRWTALLSELDV